jgi:hypothetical protein
MWKIARFTSPANTCVLLLLLLLLLLRVASGCRDCQ